MITTIISYSSNEYRFIDTCLAAARPFSSEIIVTVCDHFFDGKEENRDILDTTYAEHPDVQFIEFAYDTVPYGIGHSITNEDKDWKHYLHSTARFVAYHHRKNRDNHVLFLDADEIVDTSLFQLLLIQRDYQKYAAIRFKERFYFGTETLAGYPGICKNVLVDPKTLPEEALLDVDERRAIYLAAEGEKLIVDTVCIDHYSFVRSKEEMERKIRSWGHSYDYEWNSDDLTQGGKEIAETIFDIPFDTVPKKHDFSRTFASVKKGDFKNVTKVDRITMLTKSI